MVKLVFGAVVGSTPVVVLLPVAILLISLIELMGRKVKGDDMKQDTDETMTTTTKCWNFGRKLVGQILLTTAAMGISMTAGAAELQL